MVKWADLVLSYIRVLVWPAVIGAVLFGFRTSVRQLILNIKSIIAPGVQVDTWERAEIRVRGTEQDVIRASVSVEQRTGRAVIPVGTSTLERVRALLNFEPSQLDSLNLMDAMDQVAIRTKAAIQEALYYFGVPTSTPKHSAATLIIKSAGGEADLATWEEFLDVTDEILVDVERIKKRSKRLLTPIARAADENARAALGYLLRLAKILPGLLEKTMQAQTLAADAKAADATDTHVQAESDQGDDDDDGAAGGAGAHGPLAGALPPHPRPSLGDGEGTPGLISSPGQAEPYPGTPGAARAHFDRPGGQTLAAPENPE